MLQAYQGKPDEEKYIISLERKTSMFFFLQEAHCTKDTRDLWQNE